MGPTTPYSADLGEREPISAMNEAAGRIRSLAARWTAADFDRSYAAGKWTARQILMHLAQTELALGSRARMALTIPGYVAQAFDQDRWMAREPALGANQAVEAFAATSAMNRAFFASLTPGDRATPFTHPEYGAVSIDWLIHQMAGHLVHHLKQLEQIAG